MSSEKKMSMGKKFGNLMVSFAYLIGYEAILSIASLPIIIWGISRHLSEVKLNFSEGFMTVVVEVGVYAQFVGEIAAVLAAVLVYYYWVVKKRKKSGEYEKALPKLADKTTVLTIIFGTLAVFAAAALIGYGLTFVFPRMSDRLNKVVSSIGGGEGSILPKILGFLNIVFLAPMGEEIVVRGLAVFNNRKAFGMTGCIVISAFLFALLHGNPIQGIYALPFGALSAFVCYKYKSVIPCILMHMMNNLIGSSIDYVLPMERFWWVYIVIMFVSVGILIPTGIKNKYFQKERNDNEKNS